MKPSIGLAVGALLLSATAATAGTHQPRTAGARRSGIVERQTTMVKELRDKIVAFGPGVPRHLIAKPQRLVQRPDATITASADKRGWVLGIAEQSVFQPDGRRWNVGGSRPGPLFAIGPKGPVWRGLSGTDREISVRGNKLFSMTARTTRHGIHATSSDVILKLPDGRLLGQHQFFARDENPSALATGAQARRAWRETHWLASTDGKRAPIDAAQHHELLGTFKLYE